MLLLDHSTPPAKIGGRIVLQLQLAPWLASAKLSFDHAHRALYRSLCRSLPVVLWTSMANIGSVRRMCVTPQDLMQAELLSVAAKGLSHCSSGRINPVSRCSSSQDSAVGIPSTREKSSSQLSRSKLFQSNAMGLCSQQLQSPFSDLQRSCGD